MPRIAFLLVCAVVLGVVHGQANMPEHNLTLEFKTNHFYDVNFTMHLENAAVADWKENQTDDVWYQLVTNAWIFEPSTNETGTRYSSIRVTFDSNCYDSLNESQLQMIMYPFGYPAVSPDFTGGFVDYPTYVQLVTPSHFDNTTHILQKEYNSGEVFIGWACCMHAGITKSGKYVIIQTNLSSCDITIDAFGPTVLVSSLKLFYGTLCLILVPAIITIIAHFIMLVCQRNAVEKSEASFKRTNCECRLFWFVWVIAFGVYIGMVLVPMY